MLRHSIRATAIPPSWLPHLVHLGSAPRSIARSSAQPASSSIPGSCVIAAAIANDDPGYPSFFEFMAAMAMAHMSEAVDIACIETGLGGRRTPPRGRPRTGHHRHRHRPHRLLGDSLAHRGREERHPQARQAGPDRPPAQAEAVRGIAAERDCPLYSLRERFTCEAEQRPISPVASNAGTPQPLYANELLAQRFPSAATPTNRLARRQAPAGWQNPDLDASHNPEAAGNWPKTRCAGARHPGRRHLGEDRARSRCRRSLYARELHLVAPNQPRATPTHF